MVELTQDRVALQWAFTGKKGSLQDILLVLAGRFSKKIRRDKNAGQDGDGSGKKLS